jgi:O-antigen/teichoic acid export membrane protein
VFGESFAEAVPLTQILVWQLVWPPYLWVPGLLLALGRARTVTAMTAVDGVAYIALLFLLVPTFGVTGAAIATVLRFAVWAVAAAELGRRAMTGRDEVMA